MLGDIQTPCSAISVKLTLCINSLPTQQHGMGCVSGRMKRSHVLPLRAHGVLLCCLVESTVTEAKSRDATSNWLKVIRIQPKISYKRARQYCHVRFFLPQCCYHRNKGERGGGSKGETKRKQDTSTVTCKHHLTIFGMTIKRFSLISWHKQLLIWAKKWWLTSWVKSHQDSACSSLASVQQLALACS